MSPDILLSLSDLPLGYRPPHVEKTRAVLPEYRQVALNGVWFVPDPSIVSVNKSKWHTRCYGTVIIGSDEVYVVRRNKPTCNSGSDSQKDDDIFLQRVTKSDGAEFMSGRIISLKGHCKCTLATIRVDVGSPVRSWSVCFPFGGEVGLPISKTLCDAELGEDLPRLIEQYFYL